MSREERASRDRAMRGRGTGRQPPGPSRPGARSGRLASAARGLLAFALAGAMAACSGASGAGDGETEAAGSGSERPSSVATDGARLLVVNKSANTLSIIDPADGTEIATVPTGYGPHEVAVSPDGDRAYVTDYGTGEEPGTTLTVVDLGSADVEPGVADTIALSPHTRPHGITVASNGEIWVTTEGSRHLLHLDAEGEILGAIETGQEVTHMVALSEEHGRAYTANIGSGTVTAVDAGSGEVLAQIPTGAGAEGLDVSPDGDRVYVTNRSAGTLAEIDVATNEVTRTLPVGEFPIRVKVRPGGDQALVSNAQGNEIVAVDLDGWSVARRLPVGEAPVGILVTPDDATAYVANTRADRISVVDLDAWEVVGRIVAGEEPDGLAWSE